MIYDDIIVKNKKIFSGGKLYICKNEINLITGPNGCGKTLLLKNIFNNNKNLGKIVLLDQDNFITTDSVSILESIAMSIENNRKRDVKEIIQKYDYEYLLNLNIKGLSGGEQRIINILRSACSEADILLMDEPTNDLDYSMVEKVINLLLELKKNTTLIIVSHDDRVANIANQIFTISSNQIEIVKHDKRYSNKDEKLLSNNYNVSSSFIKKLFNYNVVNILTFLIFGFVLLIRLESFKNVVNKEIYELPNNQFFFVSTYSETISNCDNSKVLPVFAMSSLGSMNPFNMLKTIEKTKEFNKKTNIELYDLRLSGDNKNYKIYPLEFITADGTEKILVKDYYLEKYYNSSIDESYLDTSSYFVDICKDDFNYSQTYKLDLDKYGECIEELEKDKSLIMTAIAVVLEDHYSCNLFYQQDFIKEYSNHSICVSSEDVNLLAYQLDIVQEVMKEIKIINVLIISLMVINIMFLKLQMMSYIKTIVLLKNYNVRYELAAVNIQRKINNRLPILSLCIILFFILIIDMKNIPPSQVNFIFIIFLVLYCSFTYKVENILIDSYVKKYYRWDAR